MTSQIFLLLLLRCVGFASENTFFSQTKVTVICSKGCKSGESVISFPLDDVHEQPKLSPRLKPLKTFGQGFY